MTHCWAASVASRSSRSAGSATVTTVWSRNAMPEPRTVAARVRRSARSSGGIRGPQRYPRGPMPGVPAVVVDDLRKEFRLPHERVHTLKERVLHPLRRSGVDVLRALDGVSFEVAEGEFFG